MSLSPAEGLPRAHRAVLAAADRGAGVETDTKAWTMSTTRRRATEAARAREGCMTGGAQRGVLAWVVIEVVVPLALGYVGYVQWAWTHATCLSVCGSSESSDQKTDIDGSTNQRSECVDPNRSRS